MKKMRGHEDIARAGAKRYPAGDETPPEPDACNIAAEPLSIKACSTKFALPCCVQKSQSI